MKLRVPRAKQCTARPKRFKLMVEQLEDRSSPTDLLGVIANQLLAGDIFAVNRDPLAEAKGSDIRLPPEGNGGPRYVAGALRPHTDEGGSQTAASSQVSIPTPVESAAAITNSAYDILRSAILFSDPLPDPLPNPFGEPAKAEATPSGGGLRDGLPSGDAGGSSAAAIGTSGGDSAASADGGGGGNTESSPGSDFSPAGNSSGAPAGAPNPPGQSAPGGAASLSAFPAPAPAAAPPAAAASVTPGFVTYGTDPNNHESTPLPARPGYLASYTDPDFKTTVTRISDSTTATDGTTNFSNGVYWGNTVRNDYYMNQPWNADMSLLLIQNDSHAAAPATTTLSGPNPRRLILDGSTYAFKYGLPFQPWEYRWHPTDPNILFYTLQNNFYKYNVSTSAHTLIQTFSKYPAQAGAIRLDQSNPSADGRYVAFQTAYAGGWDVFVYDTTVVSPGNGTVNVVNLPLTKDDPRTGQVENFGLDWVSVTPSGNNVVVQWDDAFSEVYDRSMNFVQILTLSGLSHYDIKQEGSVEYAVGVHKNPGIGGNVYRTPVIGTTSDRLTTVGYAGNTSARNLHYPGWVYTDYHNNGTGYPLSNEMTATNIFSIADSSTIRRLGHFFNTRLDYYSEVHAVPSPDGMRVVFQSNWGNRGGNGRGTDTYVIDLRPILPFNDDFQVSNFSSIWTVSDTNYVWRSGSAGHGSTYGMRMKSKSDGSTSAQLKNAVSTVGFTSIQVQYAISAFGLTGSHKVYLDWYNGSTWNLGADVVGLTNGWTTRTVTLPSGAAGKSGFKIRFRIDGTSTSENAYIDRVKIIPT